MTSLFNKISIKKKFIYSIIMIIIFFWMISSLILKVFLTRSLYSEIVRHGESVVYMLKTTTMDMLLTDDILGLKKIARELIKNEKDIAYIYFIGSGGEEIVHTFDSSFPQQLRDLRNAIKSDSDIKTVPFRTDRGLFFDIGALALRGAKPEIHVGITTEFHRAMISNLWFTITLMSFIVLVMGILIAVHIGQSLTQPIINISEAMKKIGKGEIGNKLPVTSQDEIGRLAVSYNRMLDDLSESKERLRLNTDNMVQAEKMAALGTFISSIAHQLNNPISGMRFCLEMLAQNDFEKQKKYVHLMKDGLIRIEDLVRRLLTYSRMDTFAPASCDLRDVVRRGFSMGSLNRHAEVEFILDIKHDEPLNVYIDQTQVENVLINMIVNGIQAVSERGGYVKVGAGKEGDKAFFTVEDNGCGIPQNLINKIFDPFFTTKKEGEGTGLGLWMAYEIIQRHRGEIRVKSEENKGSIFTIFLPLSKGAVL